MGYTTEEIEEAGRLPQSHFDEEVRRCGRNNMLYSKEEIGKINEEMFKEEFRKDPVNGMMHYGAITHRNEGVVEYRGVPDVDEEKYRGLRHKISMELETIIKQETYDPVKAKEKQKKYWDALSDVEKEEVRKRNKRIDRSIRYGSTVTELESHAKRAQRFNQVRNELKGMSGFGQKPCKLHEEEIEYRNKQAIIRKIEKWIRDSDSNFVTGIGYYLIEVSDSTGSAKLSEIFKKAKEEMRQGDIHKRGEI